MIHKLSEFELRIKQMESNEEQLNPRMRSSLKSKLMLMKQKKMRQQQGNMLKI